jgi:SAM-dependent methyltransferase
MKYRLDIMEDPYSRLQSEDSELRQGEDCLIGPLCTYPIRSGIADMRLPSSRGVTSYDGILPEFDSSSEVDPLELTRAYGISKEDICGKIVCVAGAGSGTELRLVETFRPKEIHAIDFSEFVHALKARFEHMEGLYLYQGDICNMPFKAKVFDLIISGGVIQHTRSPEMAVRELVRCLVPGGLLAIGNLYSQNLHNRRVTIHRNHHMLHKMDRDRAIRFIRRNALIYYVLANTGLWRIHRRLPIPFLLEFNNIPGKSFAYYVSNAMDYYMAEYRHNISQGEVADYCAQIGAKFARSPKGYLIRRPAVPTPVHA